MFAQSGQLPPSDAPKIIEAQPTIFGDACCGCGSTCTVPRGWVGFDYLNWWITSGPIGVPLLTTGNPGSPNGGAIGDPGTHVLFGNSDINFGPLMGGRITAGYWFDCDATCGVEASGFLLAKQANSFSTSSDASGSPLLAVPFQSPAGVPSRDLISSPAVPQTGSVNGYATTQFWGADVDAVCNIYRSCCNCCSIDLLGGFCYYNLDETLQLNGNSSSTVTVPIFRNSDFTITRTTVTNTSGFNFFGTRDQFYGGEIGARRACQKGCWSAEILGKVAMGDTVQTLYSGGSTTTTVAQTITQSITSSGRVVRVTKIPPTTTTTSGGLFLNPNNIGNFENNSFSVIPSIGVKVGYDINCHLRATIGYDALFWDNVERPGNQINSLIGQGPSNNLSSVWVQGFNVGAEFRW